MDKEIIGDSTLYLGDCLDILPTLGAAGVVITSSPYTERRDYLGVPEDVYPAWASNIIRELTGRSRNGVFLNIKEHVSRGYCSRPFYGQRDNRCCMSEVKKEVHRNRDRTEIL